jgi:hypothetical protein
MLQRFLVILLMLAVPAQGIAVPHSHDPMAGRQPSDHNQRPHLHLGDHHHHHGHSHDDGRHSHDPFSCDDPGDEQDAGTPEAPIQPNDHDDDALYVSGDLGLNLTHAAPTIAETGLVLWTEPIRPMGVDARFSVNAAFHFLARGDTPIYLTTLSLRL